MSADQLALVAGESMGAGRTDLAMMIDGGLFNSARAGGRAMWKKRSNFIIKNAGSVGKHG